MKNSTENELPKIRVALRKDKMNKEGKYSLNYMIRFCGKVVKKPTGLLVREKNWSTERGEVIGSTRELERISKILAEKKAEFEKYMLKLDALGGTMSFNIIDDFFANKRFDDFYSYYESLYTNAPIEDNTKGKYALCLKVLKIYAKMQSIDTLRFCDITLDFLQGFDLYLIETKDLSSDTAWNYHKCIKHVLKDAVGRDIINKSPYMNFTPLENNRKQEVIPLTKKEIKAIATVDIPYEQNHLQKIKDYFVFIMNTGLRYSDLFRVSFDHLSFGEKDSIILTLKQYKTKKPVVIPLNQTALKLLYDYRERFNLENGLIFPEITNKTFNEELKDLAVIACIDKRMHCHLGRHTFATNLSRNGASPHAIRDLMGHTSLKTTDRYIKSDNIQLLNAVNLL